MLIPNTIILEYWIKNKSTGKYYQRRELEISVEEIGERFRDEFTAPINCDMENTFIFGDFEIYVD